MKKEFLELRQSLLFKTAVGNFVAECGNMRDSFSKEVIDATEERKKEMADIISEISIDMQSYILRWHLQKPENSEIVETAIIKEEASKNLDLLAGWGYEDKVDYVKDEVASVERSNQLKISKMTDEGIINNRLGNDAAYGLTDAIRRGTTLVTTNPVMINQLTKDEPEKMTKIRDRIKEENPDATPEKLVTLLTMEVVYESCIELWPIYEATDREKGYVSLQVSPKNSNNAEKMFDEVKFIYDELGKRLNGVPNLVFKVPATKASLDTVAKMTKMGIGVNITGSCSVAQHIALAEVIEEGNTKASFLTMMSGRLDDRIAEELEEKGIENAKEIAKKASELIVRRSYNILYGEREYEKSVLLIASLRGPWNIDAAIANKKSPIFITCFPPKAQEYDSVEREIKSTIDDEMSQDIIDTLMNSKIFRQGYEVDGLTQEEFATFFPVKVTLESFCKQYDETIEFVSK